MIKRKIKIGDLVQLSGIWKGKVGIVLATDKAWWIIKDHFDVSDCIAHKNDILRVIKKKCSI